jgi:hypothetical protein
MLICCERKNIIPLMKNIAEVVLNNRALCFEAEHFGSQSLG